MVSSLKPRFLLHANQFTERGDSVNLIGLATGLKEVLGLDSIVAFPRQGKGNNQIRIAEAEKSGLDIFQYGNRGELERLVSREQITHTYIFSDGTKAGVYYSADHPQNFRLGDTTHLTHCVFRNFEPHGDYYLYISEWLFRWSETKPRQVSSKDSKLFPIIDWFPHFVDVSNGNASKFREKYLNSWGGPIIGRIGGADQFDDKALQRALLSYIDTHPDTIAVLVNTQVSVSHPRIVYIPFLDRGDVRDFYDATTLLLNGRSMGESFGFSVVEPLTLGKPVLAPHPIRNIWMDKNHVSLLKGTGLLYWNYWDAKHKIEKMLGRSTDPRFELLLKSNVENYTSAKAIGRLSRILALE